MTGRSELEIRELLDWTATHEEEVGEYLRTHEKTISERWKKFLAYFYPDAVIRKQYLRTQHVYMGEGSFANLGLTADATEAAPVRIGCRVSIAPGVCFITNSEPNNSERLRALPYVAEHLIKEREIVVEDDVWIGAGATILPGVHIGEGAIVGAGSLVLCDVEAYSIVAGVPAKKIRELEH